MENSAQAVVSTILDSPAQLLFACLISLLITGASLKVLRPLAEKYSLIDVPDNRKVHSGHIPLIGGLAVYTGLMIPALLFLPLTSESLWLLITGTVIMLTGLLDDLKDLRVRTRLLIHLVATLVMINVGGIYIESLGNLFGFGEVHLGLWGIPLTILAVISVVNAFNMLDGIDGLAGCIAMLSIFGILSFGSLSGNYRDIDHLLILATALIPFLVSNLCIFGTKKVFLGDAGSMFMGYLITWTLIITSQGENNTIEPVNALWCAAIPIIDTLGVMCRRIKRGESPFKPDREHLHHIFMRWGFNDRVALWSILAVALGTIFLGIVAAVFFPAIEFYLFFMTFVLYGIILKNAWRFRKFIIRT